MEEVHEHKHKWYAFGCKDATYLITKSDYTPLSFFEKALLAFHKLICKFCRRFELQSKKINHLLKFSSQKNSLSLSSERKEAIKRIIAAEAAK